MTSVNPPHAAQVTADSLTDDNAICESFDLTAGDGLGDKPQDVVVTTLNEEDISDSMTWQETADFPPSHASGCYVPPSPLLPGVYAVHVRYTDLTMRVFEYNWQFEVTG